MIDPTPSVDGVAAQTPAPPTPTPPQNDSDRAAVKKWKGLLLLLLGVVNVAYIGWCALLMAVFPSTSDAIRPLVSPALMTVAVGALLLIAFAVVTVLHVGGSKVGIGAKKRALIKLAITVVPGLAISAVVPFLITRQPPLTIEIISPASAQELIAPVQMTFGLQQTMKILGEKGFQPIQFRWDINGDKKVDQETLDPALTATYDHEGIYTISVLMLSANGVTKTATKRFIIQHSVFSVSPTSPVVERPVIFSLTNLYSKPEELAQVQWDFDGDGAIDETTAEAEVTNVFYQTGTYRVSVIVNLANKTQAKYEREIIVQDPPELPFPIELKTTPVNLIGTPTFPVLFEIVTNEKIAQIQWKFGDGKKSDGVVTRITNPYDHIGNFPVEVRVRSASGVTATLDTVVRVVEPLILSDLSFEGSPNVLGNKIEGEVPLTLNLTPKTATPFVQFTWEAPEATEMGMGDPSVLQAIYRKEGTYTVTLVGQDVNNHVLRLPITINVKPPAAVVSFTADPASGVAPLKVHFDAADTFIPDDDPIGYIWNFGDGKPDVTKGASVDYEYTAARVYTVGLRVQTVGGKTYSTTRSVVVRAPVTQACFRLGRLTSRVGETVTFDPECTSGFPAGYLWDFGDGTQNDQNTDKNTISHIFEQAGTFRVTLTTTDAAGSNNSFSLTITVTP